MPALSDVIYLTDERGELLEHKLWMRSHSMLAIRTSAETILKFGCSGDKVLSEPVAAMSKL